MIRYAVSLCALATLAACGDAAPPPAEKGASAIQGDVCNIARVHSHRSRMPFSCSIFIYSYIAVMLCSI